jgi:hypothetical protein
MVVSRSRVLRCALRFRRLRVKTENHASTRFSHDAPVGVKWNVNRGFFAAHARTLGRLCVE